MSEKLLAFDIWGDYGYFRRGYTTTSTITYPFPSRTSIAGLISAILGIEKDNYHDIFNEDNSKIGLRILNPISKININLNYINTKLHKSFSLAATGENPRVRVHAEFLKNVKYRIYVSLNDKQLMEKLFNLINNHKSIYTPCLGISECIADFKIAYDDLINIESTHGENININSVILKENGINIEPNKDYGMIKSPGFMNNERKVLKFLEYYYEKNGETIQINNGNYYKIEEENIILY